MTAHDGSHGPGCFGCKLRSVQFGNVEPPPERVMDSQRARDLPAYKRLRDQGLQPKQTAGCAELEARAHSQFEIDMHKLVDPKVLKDNLPAIQDGIALARESGWSPVDQKHSAA